jgi:ubiquinone biosynthesis protein UbiJ
MSNPTQIIDKLRAEVIREQHKALNANRVIQAQQDTIDDLKRRIAELEKRLPRPAR